MNQYLIVNEWEIIEDSFISTNNRVSEGIFSLGNGYMGQRANFEEHYSGDSLQGNYMAGVYYPDKTRVGWWKNGYPEYFAKVINSINWIGIDILIDGEQLDLALCKTEVFKRTLNMKEGYLERSFEATLPSGKKVKVFTKRFLSIVTKEIGAIIYSITPLNFSGELEITPYLDGDIINEDSNYDEKFWDEVSKINSEGQASLKVKTKKLDFHVCSTMIFDIFQNGEKLTLPILETSKDKFVSNTVKVYCSPELETVIYKYVANVTSRSIPLDRLTEHSLDLVAKAQSRGFNYLLKEQAMAWEEKWLESDIVINGDVSAQQAIRFNIFQLNQTYTGEDDRLNIGPKGFTGEKYGGSTYWDTEAYCLPFYLATADEKIARNLLVYRFKQLEQAKENAKKLGFTKGALYPMVTMNGEECHNEWEITFEEIHRNGAIAHAIYDYVNYTGDKSYLGEFGLQVLVEISRFWEERVNFSSEKNKYVMLGVTGPNEYENNVNNNWYTNRIACWTLQYTLDVVDYLKTNNPARLEELDKELGLRIEEFNKWKDIIANMYYAFDEKLGYLTTSPENVGTGMKASVILHLPALTMSEEIKNISKNLSKMGMSINGMYLEGTKIYGNLYRIANKISLGLTEEDILIKLTEAIFNIIVEENRFREILLSKCRYELEDKVYRAYGILKCAILLDSKEIIDLLSNVRLGAELSLIDIDKNKLDKLLILTGNSSLQNYLGRSLDDKEIKYERAKLVKEILT